MRFRGQHLVSLVCLLAYLFASEAATVSVARELWRSCSSAGEKPCPGDPGCCPDKGTFYPGPVNASQYADHCAVVGPATTNAALTGQPVQKQEDDRSNPACPGKCHLCRAGAVPFCFTPTVVIQPLGCLGRISADSLLHLGQHSPDELIRPPMC